MTPGRGWRLPVRLLGIPVSLDPTFALVLPLFAWLIANQVGAFATLLEPLGIVLDVDVLTRGATPYLLGLLAALGLFASVVVHELGHALTARIYGVRTRMITLWFLGGVAQLDDMPRSRGAEAVVAIAGPIVSGALSLGFALVLRTLGLQGGAAFVVAYLALTNAALAIFNLLPALPLDGGRVLRSLLAIAMDRERATVIAGSVSRLVAILLGVYGILTLQLFLVIVAFFVFNAGQAEVYAERARRAFEGRTVADAMTLDPVTVDLDMPIDRFRQLRSFKPHPCYPVVDARGEIAGLARIDDAEGAEADEPLAAIVKPAALAGPGDDLHHAVQRLARDDLGRLVVVDGARRVVGILSRSDVVRMLREEGAAP